MRCVQYTRVDRARPLHRAATKPLRPTMVCRVIPTPEPTMTSRGLDPRLPGRRPVHCQPGRPRPNHQGPQGAAVDGLSPPALWPACPRWTACPAAAACSAASWGHGRRRSAGHGGRQQHCTATHKRRASIAPPRVIDIALHNSLRPGVEAAASPSRPRHAHGRVPASIPRPAHADRAGRRAREYQQQQPKGRILCCTGCSAVRAGQPRVIDLARAKPSDYAQAFAGRAVPDRGPRGPGLCAVPQRTQPVSLSRDSPVVGEHRGRATACLPR